MYVFIFYQPPEKIHALCVRTYNCHRCCISNNDNCVYIDSKVRSLHTHPPFGGVQVSLPALYGYYRTVQGHY